MTPLRQTLEQAHAAVAAATDRDAVWEAYLPARRAFYIADDLGDVKPDERVLWRDLIDAVARARARFLTPIVPLVVFR
jgi:hypothetical protein